VAEPGRQSIATRLLAHPLTKGLDLDSPETTELRRQIILSKPFLRQVYLDWYDSIAARIPEGDGAVLEVGAGGGFMDSVIRGLITSEVFPVGDIDLVADAENLPLPSSSLKAIVMTNVFHHLPNVARFLTEAERTLRPGGRIVMIEPWNTGWSRFVHERFHNEPMLPDAETWEFPTSGPLSGANAALAWIVVKRDVERLETDWRFKVAEATPFMPFRYIVSGGVSLRSLQPGWLYPMWRRIDEVAFLKRKHSVLSLIVLDRV
jgi:SAM-dependent methyltransferase